LRALRCVLGAGWTSRTVKATRQPRRVAYSRSWRTCMGIVCRCEADTRA
jgi:hypothetical protein